MAVEEVGERRREGADPGRSREQSQCLGDREPWPADG